MSPNLNTTTALFLRECGDSHHCMHFGYCHLLICKPIEPSMTALITGETGNQMNSNQSRLIIAMLDVEDALAVINAPTCLNPL